MKKFKTLISFLLVLYFVASLFLFIFQKDLLYFPTAEVEHNFKTEKHLINQTTLNLVVLNPNKQSAVIYFGGNAESVAKTASTYKNTLPLHTVYFVNYRGYGGSTGSPQEQSLYSDAQYIYDKLIPRHKNISVIGRSLGTGVATFLAATRSINKMILITPYDSIQNVAQHQYPIFPINLLLNEKFDSASRVKNIKAKTLIILAELDTLIPLERSSQLVNKFPASQVNVITIKNANHTNLSHRNRYYSLINAFL